ncbi:hypothetical protein N657DRAFT_465542 [Parathielavia appendiculata]|uniref:Uncharacterized protein n=1 Tax=Parathielavia appendiculata TaxID=2587402 RepID=A0AAN6YXP2_9PEZI|nr:hypothetical protein N657DRAFT_465542 [Parathielavia appendiculata]
MMASCFVVIRHPVKTPAYAANAAHQLFRCKNWKPIHIGSREKAILIVFFVTLSLQSLLYPKPIADAHLIALFVAYTFHRADPKLVKSRSDSG